MFVPGMVYGWVHNLSTLDTGGCFLRDSEKPKMNDRNLMCESMDIKHEENEFQSSCSEYRILFNNIVER